MKLVSQVSDQLRGRFPACNFFVQGNELQITASGGFTLDLYVDEQDGIQWDCSDGSVRMITAGLPLKTPYLDLRLVADAEALLRHYAVIVPR